MKRLFYIIFFALFINIAFGQAHLENDKFLLARELELTGQLEKARDLFEELYAENKSNPPYFDALIQIYEKLKEYDKSLILLNNALRQNPKDFNLYGKLGSVYFQMGKREEAFSIWNAGLQHEAPSAINYRIIANYIIQNRAYDEAIEVLIKGRERSNTNNLFSMDIAHLYAVTMQYEKSAKEYCQLVLNDPKLLNTVISRVSNYLNSDQAIEDYLTVTKEYYEQYETSQIAELLISILERIDRFDEAAPVVIDLDKITKAKGSKIFSFAQQAFANKAYNASANAYKLLIDEQTSLNLLPLSYMGYVKSIEADLNLRSAENTGWKYLALNDTTSFPEYRKLISSYKEITKLFNRADITNEVYYRLGVIYLDVLKQPESANECFHKSINAFRNTKYSELALEKIGYINLLSNKSDSARVVFTELLKSPRLTQTLKSNVTFLLSKSFFWESAFNESLDLLSELTNNPSDNLANDALEISLVINSANKDSVNLTKTARADLLLFQSEFAKAAEIYDSIYNTERLFYLNEYAGIKLAECYCYLGDFDQAENILTEMAENEKLGIFYDKALFLLGEVYQYGIKNLQKAVTIYRKVLDNFPTSLYLSKSRENLKAINKKEE